MSDVDLETCATIKRDAAQLEVTGIQRGIELIPQTLVSHVAFSLAYRSIPPRLHPPPLLSPALKSVIAEGSRNSWRLL